MANTYIYSPDNTYFVQGDGVSLVASVLLNFSPASVALLYAFDPNNVNVAANISSVTGLGMTVTVNFVAPFSYAVGLTFIFTYPATQPVSAASLPLPTGASTSANQAALVAKGTQGSTAVPTQDLKDSGRQAVTLYTEDQFSFTSETLMTLNQVRAGVNLATGTTYTVSAGKTLRIQSMFLLLQNSASTLEQAQVRIRIAASSVGVASPVIMNLQLSCSTALKNNSSSIVVPIPDGIEVPSGWQLAISEFSPDLTGLVTLCLNGFEY